jgi:hypothetical protein
MLGSLEKQRLEVESRTAGNHLKQRISCTVSESINGSVIGT